MKLIWEPQGSFPLKVSNYSSFHFIPSVSILMPTTYAASPLPSSSLLHLNLLYFSSFSSSHLCCTFQTFPPSLPIFSLYFRIFLYFFLPIFNCSFVSFSFYSPNRTVPYIFQQSLCKLSGWQQGVSRAVKGPCTPDPHIYRLIHTTHATHTHTHTPLCCTCQDSQQYQLRLPLNT